MTSKNIVDSRLYVQLDLSPSYLANQAFSENPSNKAHFASQLLLYDTIVIPTLDFGILPSLISWLGVDRFKEAIKSRSICFLRRDGLLAYVGNGNGISTIGIARGNAKLWEWWQEALFTDDFAALELQLSYFCPNISHRQRKILARDISSTTIHLSYDNQFFIENIAKESYRDIINSSLLSQIALDLNRESSEINLEQLLPGNKTQILDPARSIKDAVDLVLADAEVNVQILMGIQANNADLLVPQGAESLLAEKLRRKNADEPLADKFAKLLDLTNIPDIRPAVADNLLPLSKIWNIRESKNGEKFRDWLRKVNPDDARSLEKSYVEMLEKDTLVASLPIRLMRFAITTASGVINPLIGTGVGVLDSFFIDKWLSGYSPKLFLDDLRKLAISEKSK